MRTEFYVSERLPEEYRAFLRHWRDFFEEDIRQLREVLEAESFRPSTYWPTRRHVYLGITELEAWVTAFDLELECERAGDYNWQRASAWADEAERRHEVLETVGSDPCVRDTVTRPLHRRCSDEEWAARRGCAHHDQRGIHHGKR